jgi:hypothetical protein
VNGATLQNEHGPNEIGQTKRSFVGRTFWSDVAVIEPPRVGAKAADLQEKIQACGGAQGLPRVLRARWMPKINTWMDMG